jgi:uncharacterized protein (DUF885 family)
MTQSALKSMPSDATKKELKDYEAQDQGDQEEVDATKKELKEQQGKNPQRLQDFLSDATKKELKDRNNVVSDFVKTFCKKIPMQLRKN